VSAIHAPGVSWPVALLRLLAGACNAAAARLEQPSLRAEPLEPSLHVSAHERLSEMRGRYY
jgi:hypothetical protein